MSAAQNRFKQAHAPSGGSAAAPGGKRGGPKNAAQNRFKQACVPEGLSPAAPSLPAQAGTGRRAADSGGGLSSAAALAAKQGVL